MVNYIKVKTKKGRKREEVILTRASKVKSVCEEVTLTCNITSNSPGVNLSVR